MRKILALLLILALCLPCAALGEGFGEYDGPEWTFGVSLKHLHYAKLKIVSPAQPADASYVPEELEALRARRNDDYGNNINSGVYFAGSGNMALDRSCANALMMMMASAESHGIVLYLRQAYRSYGDQQKRYDRAVKQGNAETIQKAGESDYQTGLGLVLVGKDWRGKPLTADFMQSPEAVWLTENAMSFGFVVRYPEGKEAVTGVAAEPWHLRYVGEGVSAYMYRKGITLEEFTAELEQAYADFEAAGGDLAAAEASSFLPEGPVELRVTGPDGDTEIVLFHD